MKTKIDVNSFGSNDFPSSLSEEEIEEIIKGKNKVENKNIQPNPIPTRKDKGHFVSDPFGDEESTRVMM